MRLLLALVLGLAAAGALAQYPNRTVRMVVPFPAGGPTDVLTRVVAQKLSERWQQPVIVENKPGAGGAIGSDFVAKSAPDGYTLLMATSSTHSIGPALQKLPYDPQKDFAPIVHLWSAPNVMLVSPALGSIVTGQQHARSGKVRMLAMSTARRSPLLPELPTMQEAGVPDYESNTWFGIFGPAGTPADVVARVNADSNALAQAGDVRERFAGAELAGATPEAFARLVRSDFEKWSGVIRQANVKVQ